MPRKRYGSPPTSIDGHDILVTTPIAELLRRTIGIGAFLEIVGSGRIDPYGRTNKFRCDDAAIDALKGTARELPRGIPHIEGVLTWRKVPQCWSLDVKTTLLDGNIRWWEMLPKGTGDAKINIRGAQLPELVMAHIEGRRLCEVVEHPMLTDPEIRIRNARNYDETTVAGYKPACVEMNLDVPRVVVRR